MGLLDEISSNDLEEVCRKLDESSGDSEMMGQVTQKDKRPFQTIFKIHTPKF